jgi:hypothetical protein
MNVAQIRTLVNTCDLARLDELEAELMAKMDDDQNDLEVLGGELTDILGARQILQRVQNEGVPKAEALRDFMRSVRDIIN